MSALLKLMAASGGVAAQTYVDDVFAAVTRTGTGASAAQTPGIDLSTKAGLVWTKGRSGATSHKITDTKRGVTKAWSSDSTAADVTDTNGITAFSSTGYTVGSDSNYNTNAATYVDWVMREAANFLSIVQFTGNNVSTGRTIAHTLGSAPGMVIIVDDNSVLGHYVWHRSATSGNFLLLNSTAAQSNTAANTFFGNGTITVDPDASNFTVGLGLNVTATNYTAYCFGHDTSATGIIQCGSYTGNGSATGPIVTLGMEPQWVYIKEASAVRNHTVFDTSRGFDVSGTSLGLNPNDAGSEVSTANPSMKPLATGFQLTTSGAVGNENGGTYIYMAIRRSNKPPTAGTQVYNAIAQTGTGAATTVTGVGFSPDTILSADRNVALGRGMEDRLRGANRHYSTTGSGAEQTTTDTVTSFDANGVHLGADQLVSGAYNNSNASNYIYYFLKRAVGVFDEICYTGTGSNKTESHNLTVAPELWIVKGRSGSTDWIVGSTQLANTEKLLLDTTAAKATDATAWNSTFPSSTVISLGTLADVNTNTATYAAYLFATLAGISKIGAYTGNGTSQTIACGFAAGARFILIKRTDNTGDWFVWDTVRGIVAGNDPHLSLNTGAVEVTTDDSIDPDNSGFIVNQLSATNINVNAATYVFLAFA